MRGDQLAAIAKSSSPDRTITLAPSTARFRNSTLFLTKGALKELDEAKLSQLKKRGNRLLFDVVDEVPPPTTTGFADVLIASSLTAFSQFQRDFPGVDVSLVNHHVDPRISRSRTAPPTDQLRTAYFGELVNAILTDGIREQVTTFHVDTSRESSDWIPEVPHFNFHYAVRLRRGLDKFKPFLKGFTAAHTSSNMLIQSDQVEAVAWLGDDYPYLLWAEPTEANILAALQEAKESFGSPEWFAGLKVMADIRERTSEVRIGHEIRRALS